MCALSTEQKVKAFSPETLRRTGLFLPSRGAQVQVKGILRPAGSLAAKHSHPGAAPGSRAR